MGNFGWEDAVPFGMGPATLRPLKLCVADADAGRMDARDEAAVAGLARVLAPVLVTDAAFKLFLAVLLFDAGAAGGEANEALLNLQVIIPYCSFFQYFRLIA